VSATALCREEDVFVVVVVVFVVFATVLLLRWRIVVSVMMDGLID